MSILSAFIAFDILMIVYEIIIEVFSSLYELSGLTKEQARFQVTSLLTGTGFTTQESEKMLSTKRRKRVTRDIMIISYIFNLTIISTLVAIFTSMLKSTWSDLIFSLIISSFIIVLLFCSRKIAKVRIRIDKIVMYLVNKFLYKKENQLMIYDYYQDKIIAEVKLNNLPKKLVKNKIRTILENPRYNLQIFTIYRDGVVISKFDAHMEFKKKDTLILLGKKNDIRKLFLK